MNRKYLAIALSAMLAGSVAIAQTQPVQPDAGTSSSRASGSSGDSTGTSNGVNNRERTQGGTSTDTAPDTRLNGTTPSINDGGTGNNANAPQRSDRGRETRHPKGASPTNKSDTDRNTSTRKSGSSRSSTTDPGSSGSTNHLDPSTPNETGSPRMGE